MAAHFGTGETGWAYRRSSEATNGAKYSFQVAATVWVPWPRVLSLIGMRT